MSSTIIYTHTDEAPALATISLLPGKGRNFSFRLDWTQPKNEIISVVNGQYVAYNPGIKRAYTGNSDSQKVQEKGGNALKIMSMSKEEIKANYDVEYLGQETISGGIPTWRSPWAGPGGCGQPMERTRNRAR